MCLLIARARTRGAGVAVFTGLVLVVVLGAGCYDPKIQDGGLVCAATDGGLRCPEGYQCGTADNHCYRSGGQCAKATPLCAEQPAIGNECSPVCQNGCACGRCNVQGLAAVCTPLIGPKALGEVCAPDRDDCGAGLICLLEACGNRLGRCYRHCDDGAQCATGVLCETPILDGTATDTGFLTCDLAPQACDPINATGCPSSALGCYIGAAGATFCDCPNRTLRQDDACQTYNDCALGLACVSGSGVSGQRCRPICRPGGASCAGGQACVSTGGTYGYCPG